MNIELSDNLKRLRKEKKVTQERLAAHLDISAQSVGKWERGEGFPDITLLPAIAMYFDVTIDDLMGVGEMKVQNAIDAYEAESKKLRNAGDVNGNLKLWEKAYSEFPCSDRVQYGLMNALYTVYAWDTEAHSDEAERVIALGEKILEKSNDTGLREGAVQVLCFTYHYRNDSESAKKYAGMMGEYCTTRDELLKIVLDGDEAVEKCQENIKSLFDLAAGNAYVMSWKGKYGPNEKIRIFRFCISLLCLLYENGDFGFYSCRISQYYSDIAYEYAVLGDGTNCLEALENMTKFAVLTDTQNDFRHTSFMVNRTEHKREETSKNYSESECELRLKRLSDKAYDFIRDDESFRKITCALRSAIAEQTTAQ